MYQLEIWCASWIDLGQRPGLCKLFGIQDSDIALWFVPSVKIAVKMILILG